MSRIYAVIVGCFVVLVAFILFQLAPQGRSGWWMIGSGLSTMLAPFALIGVIVTLANFPGWLRRK